MAWTCEACGSGMVTVRAERVSTEEARQMSAPNDFAIRREHHCSCGRRDKTIEVEATGWVAEALQGLHGEGLNEEAR
jgi:hypothetical protein